MQRLSELYSGREETVELANGNIAEYLTSTISMEVTVAERDGLKKAVMRYQWDEISPILRGLYVKELDHFFSGFRTIPALFYRDSAKRVREGFCCSGSTDGRVLCARWKASGF